MKVLLIIPYFAPVYGGPSKVVRELAQGLGKLGITADIITTNANGYEKSRVPLNTWVEEDGYRVKYFNCWHKNDLVISLSLIQWLCQNIQTYDLVHTNNRFAPMILLGEWICQFFRIPYVVTPHGMLEPWALSYKAKKKWLYYKLLEKPTLQKASAIQVLNSVEAKNLHSLGLSQTAIIPNGIHPEAFSISPDPAIFYQQFPQTQNKSVILFLGRIDPKKGLDLLATAFAKVHHQFPETHLVVAGPDSIEFLPIVKRYFAEAGCLEAVTFTGMLTGTIKQAALASAQVYVAPSYSEGFSMSVLEGMASGLPCVITTGCNFPEAAAAQAAYVVEINADKIADALIQFLSQPQQAKTMGNQARRFILQQYSWDQAAEKLVQVYKLITSSRKLEKTVMLNKL